MVASDSFILEFKKFLSGWVFFVVDSVGNSSGRIRGWSLQRKLLNSFSIFSGLLTKVFSLELDWSFFFLNLYGTYEGKEHFWYRLFGLQCLHMDNLIIGGDLNFTIRNEHIWGSLACEDKLAHFLLISLNGTAWLMWNLLRYAPHGVKIEVRRKESLKYWIDY